MASVKQQKQQLIKRIEKKFEKLQKETYLTKTQNETFSKSIENINKKSLKELNTLNRALNKNSIQSITKDVTNLELKRAYKKDVSLSSKQIQELGKKDLLDTAKEFLSIDVSRSKELTQKQKNLASGKLNIPNLEKMLQSDKIQDVIKKTKEKKEYDSTIDDFEYLEEIANRSGVAKYIGLCKDSREYEYIMNNVRSVMDNTDRNDYYQDVLKNGDYTYYYTNFDEMQETEMQNAPWLELME